MAFAQALPAAIFALNLLVGTERGGCYSHSEYEHWLREAGFSSVRQLAVSAAGSTGLLEACR
jgi:hypothetical protein